MDILRLGTANAVSKRLVNAETDSIVALSDSLTTSYRAQYICGSINLRAFQCVCGPKASYRIDKFR
jgi:hypothetical protein